MAKRKKRKEEKIKNNFTVELFGLFLVLFAIIGIYPFGKVGFFFECFSVFLVGTWYNVLLVLIGIIGIYMMIKRDKPKYFSSNLIGFYIMIISILILTHLVYKDYVGFEMIRKTFDDLLGFFNHTISEPPAGAGMLGACLASLFLWLLDLTGTKVVAFVLLGVGFTMFTGLSIYDVIKWIKDETKTVKDKRISRKDKIEISKIENDYDSDDKVVISSIEELTSNNTKEEKVNNEQKEVSTNTSSEEDKVDNTPYFYPPINLLNRPGKNSNKENEDSVKQTVPLLERVLKEFDIESKVVSVHVGPAVTQYELEVKTGTKLNKILAINREIALALAAKEVRIEAPIPGKSTVGIELPNKKNSMVTVREVLEHMPSSLKESKLAVTLGRDIMGSPKYCEINKTPHLLVAGSTGSGKSVCINSIIVSILMRTRPDEVKLVLVDPKKVELSIYNGVPHLLAPVVTDAKKANIALKKMVSEMERRYDKFEETGTKNIAGYNAYIDKKNQSLPDEEKIKHMPYIVIIIDELADLMLVAAKEVQDSIMRITQMARAAGMHLIVATQRPSTDVITGVVKANIPSRIAFAVSSGIDSRTILDQIGAEKLLGKGDMLFLPQGENTPMRIQGTFISDDEIKSVVDYVIKQQKAHYDETLTMSDEEMNATTMTNEVEGQDYDPGEDPLYNQVVEYVITSKKASTSLIQRRFRIGYNRAANLVDKLEERGIVGPQNGSKPREVLVELKEDE